MGGRDHSCEVCGRGGLNDPGGDCACIEAPLTIYRVEIPGLLNPAAIHFGPEVGDVDRVAQGWRDAGARVVKYHHDPSKPDYQYELHMEECAHGQTKLDMDHILDRAIRLAQNVDPQITGPGSEHAISPDRAKALAKEIRDLYGRHRGSA